MEMETCSILMETKSFDPLNSSGGDHSGITFENTSGKMMMMGCVSGNNDVGSHDKRCCEEGEDGGYGDEDERNNGGKKKVVKGGETKKVRRPRFAFQTRSQVDILDDGYRWRKYGQKAVKNNNFPRSYYRCTHQGCNVKKQVQRLSKDEEVVVTTYEGTHTHPIERNSDNFEQILKQMQIYTTF